MGFWCFFLLLFTPGFAFSPASTHLQNIIQSHAFTLLQKINLFCNRRKQFIEFFLEISTFKKYVISESWIRKAFFALKHHWKNPCKSNLKVFSKCQTFPQLPTNITWKYAGWSKVEQSGKCHNLLLFLSPILQKGLFHPTLHMLISCI
jgi:hypothetical protein